MLVQPLLLLLVLLLLLLLLLPPLIGMVEKLTITVTVEEAVTVAQQKCQIKVSTHLEIHRKQICLTTALQEMYFVS